LLATVGFHLANKKIQGQMEVLGLVLPDERRRAVEAVLEEIDCQCYCGPHPPNHLSNEPQTKGVRMLHFVWNSRFFAGKPMYFKFCIRQESKKEILFVFSLHEDFGPEGD
jgi:hypothetical protein